MVASGAITSTLGVITSLSCIVVLLASPVDGALLVYARARLGSTRRQDSATLQGHLASREALLQKAASNAECVAVGPPLAWEHFSASFIPPGLAARDLRLGMVRATLYRADNLLRLREAS